MTTQETVGVTGPTMDNLVFQAFVRRVGPDAVNPNGSKATITSIRTRPATLVNVRSFSYGYDW